MFDPSLLTLEFWKAPNILFRSIGPSPNNSKPSPYQEHFVKVAWHLADVLSILVDKHLKKAEALERSWFSVECITLYSDG